MKIRLTIIPLIVFSVLAIDLELMAQNETADIRYPGYRRNVSGHAQLSDTDSRSMAAAKVEKATAGSQLALSNLDVDRNSPAGSVVGLLHTNIASNGLVQYYVLAEENDSDLFEVSGNQLVTKQRLVYDSTSSYVMDVLAIDKDQNILYSNFILHVNEAVE